jgi:hypothetical protein
MTTSKTFAVGDRVRVTTSAGFTGIRYGNQRGIVTELNMANAPWPIAVTLDSGSRWVFGADEVEVVRPAIDPAHEVSLDLARRCLRTRLGRFTFVDLTTPDGLDAAAELFVSLVDDFAALLIDEVSK